MILEGNNNNTADQTVGMPRLACIFDVYMIQQKLSFL